MKVTEENGKKIVTIEEDEFCELSGMIIGAYITAKMDGKSSIAVMKMADKLATVFSGMAKILFDEEAANGLKKCFKDDFDYSEDDEDE